MRKQLSKGEQNSRLSASAQGVPTVLVQSALGARLLPSSALYGDFDALMTHIKVSKA
jgi:hypothetical protein